MTDWDGQPMTRLTWAQALDGQTCLSCGWQYIGSMFTADALIRENHPSGP
jgi:hypothetical protein